MDMRRRRWRRRVPTSEPCACGYFFAAGQAGGVAWTGNRSAVTAHVCADIPVHYSPASALPSSFLLWVVWCFRACQLGWASLPQCHSPSCLSATRANCHRLKRGDVV